MRACACACKRACDRQRETEGERAQALPCIAPGALLDTAPVCPVNSLQASFCPRLCRCKSLLSHWVKSTCSCQVKLSFKSRAGGSYCYRMPRASLHLYSVGKALPGEPSSQERMSGSSGDGLLAGRRAGGCVTRGWVLPLLEARCRRCLAPRLCRSFVTLHCGKAHLRVPSGTATQAGVTAVTGKGSPGFNAFQCGPCTTETCIQKNKSPGSGQSSSTCLSLSTGLKRTRITHVLEGKYPSSALLNHGSPNTELKSRPRS